MYRRKFSQSMYVRQFLIKGRYVNQTKCIFLPSPPPQFFMKHGTIAQFVARSASYNKFLLRNPITCIMNAAFRRVTKSLIMSEQVQNKGNCLFFVFFHKIKASIKSKFRITWKGKYRSTDNTENRKRKEKCM